MNKVIQYILTSVLTSLLSMLIISAMLPKGLKIRQLPQFISMIKQHNGNLNAHKFLELMENEEKLALMMKQLDGGEIPAGLLVDNQSVATQAKPGSIVIDQSELEELDKMNISKELQDEIRRNYGQVGTIGEAKIERAPASVKAEKEVLSVMLSTEKSYEESLKRLHASLTHTAQKPTN
jgi:hypothetical protein